MIKESVAKIVAGKDLSQSEMEETMNEIMTGAATPAQIGAFITALRMKGETVEEITGAARVMRAKATKLDIKNHPINIDRDDINIEDETILDTCGTGGDGTRPPLWRQAAVSSWPSTGTGPSPASAEALMCSRHWA